MAEPKRKRPRSSSVKADKTLVAQRVIDFYTQDIQARTFDIEARLQRTAKFRMWTEPKDWPWEDASNSAVPDIMTASLRMQDTIHNAVMSQRPAVVSKAVQKANKDKSAVVDNLLDYQFFVEAKGEKVIGEMADAFVNDGVVTVFIPWVREERETHEVRVLEAIPADMPPGEYFALQLMRLYPKAQIKEIDKEGWRWRVMLDEDETFVVDFYTLPSDEVEMDAAKLATVFDGPRPIVKDYEDVLHNARAANLQIPSPSNPGGSAHVILIDYPTLDEIKRLAKSGYYDLLDDEGLERLGMAREDITVNQEEKAQKDALGGVNYQGEAPTVSGTSADGNIDRKVNDHKVLTRLMCFDIYDVDGDGKNEDVIWWVIKEEKLLLRARELTQVFPANPPRRPFAEGQFIEVRGRRCGIGLPEMMEGLHDLQKQIIDQTIDNGTITNVPFFFYRQTGSMRPEVIRMWPGEGYPVSDPKNDIYFPQLPQQGMNFGFNMIQVLNQMEERLTSVGDLQLGRVPQGKASALRTVRGMQTILQQGDARPERILRRFFMCLTELYAQMHELNQAFLPKGKQYRIAGMVRAGEDPYRMLDDPAQVRGRFQFDFMANAMNTSKEGLQAALQELMAVYVSPIAIQLGVLQPDGFYQLARDYGKAWGQDPDRYISPPAPESMLPPALAEEVISIIMAGNLPEVRPLEPPEEHMSKLMDFTQKPEFGLFTPQQVDIFRAYLKIMQARIAEQQKRLALMSAAGAQGPGGGGQGGVPGPVPGAQPPAEPSRLGKGELADESLPSAGGGGNQGPMQ